jgi:N-acetylmuramoyl-L-alanine amidase
MRLSTKNYILLSLAAVLFAGVFANAYGASKTIRFTRAFGRKYVYLRDVASYYGMKCYVWKDRTVLYSKYSKLTFFPQKKTAYLNGVKTALNFAPFNRGIQSFLSYYDFLYTVDPALRAGAVSRHKMKVIMIDPGHGGKDDGGSGHRVKEKDVVLSLGHKVTAILRSKGYKVIITRASDRFLTLQQRADAASRQGADLFISIHTNTAKNRNVAGIETFCMAPVGTSSTYSKKIVNKRESGNYYDKNNMLLAYFIQKSIVKNSKGEDRGVKRARFYVLRNVKCPAVLIEAGFLTNSREENRLASNWYQNLIARGICEGILRYHRRLLQH